MVFVPYRKTNLVLRILFRDRPRRWGVWRKHTGADGTAVDMDLGSRACRRSRLHDETAVQRVT